MEENTFSIKEILERVEKKLEINTGLTSDLVVKVGVQNGRVTTQEKWSTEAKSILETNAKNIENVKDEYKGDKRWIKGAVWVISALLILVPTICTFVFGLYLKNRDYQIDEKIKNTVSRSLSEALDNKFDKLEVIK